MIERAGTILNQVRLDEKHFNRLRVHHKQFRQTQVEVRIGAGRTKQNKPRDICWLKTVDCTILCPIVVGGINVVKAIDAVHPLSIKPDDEQPMGEGGSIGSDN